MRMSTHRHTTRRQARVWKRGYEEKKVWKCGMASVDPFSTLMKMMIHKEEGWGVVHWLWHGDLPIPKSSWQHWHGPDSEQIHPTDASHKLYVETICVTCTCLMCHMCACWQDRGDSVSNETADRRQEWAPDFTPIHCTCTVRQRESTENTIENWDWNPSMLLVLYWFLKCVLSPQIISYNSGWGFTNQQGHIWSNVL